MAIDNKNVAPISEAVASDDVAVRSLVDARLTAERTI